MNYSALIVDDEHSGRTSVKIALTQQFGHMFREIDLAGTLDLAKTLGEKKFYNLCFLDIQLGEHSGFELIPHLDKSTQIIFVTAYSEFAIKAIRARAFDYLLKPLNPDELRTCIFRFIKNQRPITTSDKFLRIKNQGETIPVPLKEIEYIKAKGSYSEVKLVSKSVYIVSRTLKTVLPDLDDSFIRIHKSYIVNRSYIQSFQKDKLTTTFNSCLPLSRNGARELSQQF